MINMSSKSRMISFFWIILSLVAVLSYCTIVNYDYGSEATGIHCAFTDFEDAITLQFEKRQSLLENYSSYTIKYNEEETMWRLQLDTDQDLMIRLLTTDVNSSLFTGGKVQFFRPNHGYSTQYELPNDVEFQKKESGDIYDLSFLPDEDGWWYFKIIYGNSTTDETFHMQISLQQAGYSFKTASELNESHFISGYFATPDRILTSGCSRFWKVYLEEGRRLKIDLTQIDVGILEGSELEIYRHPTFRVQTESETSGSLSISYLSLSDDWYYFILKHDGSANRGNYLLELTIDINGYSIETAVILSEEQETQHYVQLNSQYYFTIDVPSPTNVTIILEEQVGGVLREVEFTILRGGDPISEIVVNYNTSTSGKSVVYVSFLARQSGRYFFVLSHQWDEPEGIIVLKLTSQSLLPNEWWIGAVITGVIIVIFSYFVSFLVIDQIDSLISRRKKILALNHEEVILELHRLLKSHPDLSLVGEKAYSTSQLVSFEGPLKMPWAPRKWQFMVGTTSKGETWLSYRVLMNSGDQLGIFIWSTWIASFLFLILNYFLLLVTNWEFFLTPLNVEILQELLLRTAVIFPIFVLLLFIRFTDAYSWINDFLRIILTRVEREKLSASKVTLVKDHDVDKLVHKKFHNARRLWNQARQAFKRQNYVTFLIKAESSLKHAIEGRYIQFCRFSIQDQNESSFYKLPGFLEMVETLREQIFDVPKFSQIEYYRRLRNNIVHGSAIINSDTAINAMNYYQKFLTRIGIAA